MPVALAHDLELTDGVTTIPLMLKIPEGRNGQPGPVTIQEALVASDADAPLSEWLEVVVREDWSRGAGMDYDNARCLDTWSSPGYVLPAGAATDVVLPAVGMSATPLVAIEEYFSDLFVAQRGSAIAGTARVLRSVGGTGSGAGLFTTSLTLGAGEYLQDLLVAENGSGVQMLFASSSSLTGGSGRLHRWDGGSWTSTAVGLFGTWGRNRLAKVFWTGEDGIGGWRMVAISSNQGHISYTRPDADPMLAASWVEGIRSGSSLPSSELVAARRHVYINARDNLFDFNELGDTVSLTSFGEYKQGTGNASVYLDGWVFRSYGFWLDRVNVDAEGVLQEVPGICSPGFATPVETGWGSGYVTALTTHLGYVLAAVFNPSLNKAAVWRGKDRSHLGVETQNPLVWWGPEAVCSEPAIVTRMAVKSLATLPAQTKLWLATWSTDQVSPPKLTWISLPSAGGALADLRAGGSHTYTPGNGTGTWQAECVLEMLPTTVGDKGSVKELFQVTIGSLGLGDAPGTRLISSQRADPQPASVIWSAGTDITAGPTQTFTPEILRGNKLQQRIQFISPSGAASPPKPAILDSLRTTAWRTAPSFDTRTLDVTYGPGILDRRNGSWTHQGMSVEWYTDQLIAFCRAGRLTMTDRQGIRYSVKLKQSFVRVPTMTETPYGKIVEGRLVIALLGVL
jgi:hypothetical protein